MRERMGAGQASPVPDDAADDDDAPTRVVVRIDAVASGGLHVIARRDLIVSSDIAGDHVWAGPFYDRSGYPVTLRAFVVDTADVAP
jgi:hypothetical protein